MALRLTTDYPPASRGAVVIWGLLARAPYGGMTWQALHHVVALRRLGYDVWYVEDSDALPAHPLTRERTLDPSANVTFLARWMSVVGLGDRWAYRYPKSSEVVGALDFAALRRLYRSADAVINVCGGQEVLPYHLEANRLVYLETDPFLAQVQVAQGDAARIAELDSYDCLFSYGVNLGTPGCDVPVVRYSWHPTVPPVITDWWSTQAAPSIPALTTVANWKTTGKDVFWRDRLWRWSKHERFSPFLDLPRRVSLPLEIAVIGAGEATQDLVAGGWSTRSGWNLADPMDYMSFIRDSLGEFSVAKEQYVVPRTGWFSDRTVCYLAAGRPAVVEDTGIGEWLATDSGVLTFATLDEAVAAVESVAAHYAVHVAAAREIAREYFCAERVLDRVMTISMAGT